MTPISTEVDASDPIVVGLTWALMMGSDKVPWLKDHRTWIPVVAILVGVLIRAIMDSAGGEPLTLETLARGFAAGAAAVFGHSQMRELHKLATKEEKKSEGDDA